MTMIDEEIEKLKNDNTISKITKYDINGKLILQLKRVPTVKDSPIIRQGTIIVEKPKFYGEWQDVTEEALANQKLKNKANKTGRSQRELDIEAAEELLRTLRGNSK